MCTVNITSVSSTRLNYKFSLQAFLTLCSKPDLCTHVLEKGVSLLKVSYISFPQTKPAEHFPGQAIHFTCLQLAR